MAKGKNAQLTASREISYVNQRDPLLGSLLRKIISAVNTTAVNAAVSSIGKLSPPPAIDSHNVQGALDTIANTMSVSGEVLHYTLVHNQAIQKGLHYISELDTLPSFPSPHIVDHGCSRSAFVSLPTNDNTGAPQGYYLRSYAQYRGSDPGVRTTFGGAANPIKIFMGGTSNTTILPSQGSGTAKNGNQGGVGLGVVLNRPAPGPKRSVA